MNEKEAVKQLNELPGDPECAHSSADKILLQFLRDNGHEAVAKAWIAADNMIGFWYA